ncbi:uncharacterized protein LOC125046714 [Penaeus chinensis]|uniref:uncharacterized protein LOC125046714 n=1 Tax=Penaeus chinensis TaxID=139456 RepID=UPI001FB70A9B|nr:uncharacterized protein LOC125046714 [Penaeus chinensis]XP_047500561.1 uncharacterized protein LOC125046714 [Penaeus chinensis]XP_047500562.1 uncharacterized protein LOC125046714 [Penaeus chinensis]
MANDQNQISDSSYMFYKLFAIVQRGKAVQEQVFKWGYTYPWHIPIAVTLREQGMRETEFRYFSRHERDLLKQPIDLSKFDVTLMHKLLGYVSGLARRGDAIWLTPGDTLEYHLTTFKNMRNSLFHEEFNSDLETCFLKGREIQDVLKKILSCAVQQYQIDYETYANLCQELDHDINSIINIKETTVRESVFVTDLKNTYSRLSVFSPLFNLFDDTKNIHVDNVFTEMKITLKESEEDNEEHAEVKYDELLMVAEKKLKKTNKSNILMILEGPAGAGKTTITRKIIHDWSSNKSTSTMSHLKDYEFVLLCECKEQNVKSLPELLMALMTCESQYIKKEELVGKLTNKKILFIVDGYDELNPSSKEVFREIIQMGESNNIVILCTTRPNKVKAIKLETPENFAVLDVEVHGISLQYREIFVSKYSRSISSGQDESEYLPRLLNYLRRREIWQQRHWDLPLNLVLLTILWIYDPQAINRLTSATELFVETLKLSKKNVEGRLLGGVKKRNLDPSEMRSKIEICLKALYKEAFISHIKDNIGLEEASVQRLMDTCGHLNLPCDEILGGFLVRATSDVNEDITYTFPHKDLQEFYMAMYINDVLQDLSISQIVYDIETYLQISCIPLEYRQRILTPIPNILKEYESCKSSRTIMNVLEQIFEEVVEQSEQVKRQLDLKNLRGILIHLTGIMLWKRSLGEKRAEEITALLKDSGVESRVHWLYILSLVNCNDTLVKHVARMMKLTGHITISGRHIAPYTRVLKYAQPKSVLITVSNRPDVPLQEVFMNLQESWEVKVCLEEDFQNSTSINSDTDKSLKEMFQRCRVTGFCGILSNTAASLLPSHLQYLSLTVPDSNQYEFLVFVLNLIPDRQPQLKHLWLHIKGRIPLSMMKPLPAVQILDLTLNCTDETGVDWVCQAVKALQPVGDHQGYSTLKFPGATENILVCEQLLNGLASSGIKVRERLEFSPPIRTVEKQRLKDLCRTRLGWQLNVMEEEDIWTIWWSRNTR